MDWTLTNPRKDIKEVFINTSHAGQHLLYVHWSWSGSAKPVSDYPFKSDSAAKRYYATHYQSKRLGLENPKWVKK